MKRYPETPEFYTSGHSYRDSKRKRKWAKLNTKYLLRLKRYGCWVTGLRCPPDQLVWHHVEDKAFNISSGIYRSRKSLKRELRKCILVHEDIHDLIHESPQWAARAREIYRLRRKN